MTTSLRIPRTLRRHLGGFTLIELMIAVAIVGILLRLAFPAYTASVAKSRRAEAKAALLDLASREERYFSTANVYTPSAPLLGYGATYTVTTSSPMAVLSGSTAFYNLSVVTPDPAQSASVPSFIATATATATQLAKDPKCGNFILTQAGVQTVSGTDTADKCW